MLIERGLFKRSAILNEFTAFLTHHVSLWVSRRAIHTCNFGHRVVLASATDPARRFAELLIGQDRLDPLT